MYTVYFLENKDIILCQLLRNLPGEGDMVTIKGKKGTVTSLQAIDENKIHIQLAIQKIPKAKLAADNSKKKKR